MGRRGPLAKDPGRTVGHRPQRSRVSIVGEVHQGPPRPPTKLLPITRREWDAFWVSGIATLVTEVDRPVVERLFRKRDELRRVEKVIQEARLVKGSMGQVRVNPLVDYAAKLEAAILRLEMELGLTPYARMRLGIAVGEAQHTLEELNRRFDDTDGDDTDADDAFGAGDPRADLALVQLPGAHERRQAAP